MDIFLNITLLIHIVFGFLALLSGIVAMTSRKGLNVHRLAGKIFVLSMLGVSISAISISILKNNQFLLLIGVFAFYQNYNGYRAIKNKTLKPSLFDWIVFSITVINTYVMIYTTNIILMVFGGICTLLIIGQLRIFVLVIRGKEIPKLQWLRQHVGMMVGSYIATITAFLIVNIKKFNPIWLPWLAPTFILVPLIIYWTKKYSVKPQQENI